MLAFKTLAAFTITLGALSVTGAPTNEPRWGGHRWGSNVQISDPAPNPVVAVTNNPQPAPVADGNTGGGSEQHSVTLVNRCGSGQAVFLYQGNATPQGSTTINGALKGGVAWIDGFAAANCLSSGVNCGTVEFTLINPTTDAMNTQNSINYSLQSMGNHQFTYAMQFAYTGGCSGGAPGQCSSASTCPGAFWDTDATNGTPVQCLGNNAGITITFC